MNGTVKLLINKTSGEVFAQVFGISPSLGLETPAGPLTPISIDSMEKDGAQIVCRLLESAKDAIPKPGDGINGLKGRERASFLKRHHQINFRITKPGVLFMILMREHHSGRRSGYIGNPEDSREIPYPPSEVDFQLALKQVLTMAG